jgi:hypothetical protein
MKTLTILLIIILSSELHASERISKVTTIDLANPGRLTGRITDAASGMPIEFASVAIYSEKDSLLVAGTITNKDGRFCIRATHPAHGYVVFNVLGFKKKTISLSEFEKDTNKVNIGEIELTRYIVYSSRIKKRHINKNQ